MPLRTFVMIGALCVVLTPARAGAEWFLTPFVGAAFGGGVADGPKVDYGGAAGWMGRVVGFEVDVSHRPDFFAADDAPDFLFGESSVTSIMFNGLVAAPGVFGKRLRPYAAGGVGLVRSRIGGDEDFIRGDNDNFGFNVGGGVLGHLTDRIGVRGDIRFFRDLQDLEGESEFFNLGNEKLDFWRATLGVTFRF
ncbi:MAG: outer membrane beta-barrel protein [Acidobacteria bacterium]|nr:outer membrane beta-barrel protein [Acidobacteriota bacterium]